VTLNEIRQECENAELNSPKAIFYGLLLNASKEKVLNNKKVGWFLSQNKDKIVSGLALRKRERSDAAHWRVEVVKQEPEKPEAPEAPF
jgi:CRISPR/Cas system CMR-associated protein Cmr1 (group 7 of RAMP superfamily)